MSIHNMKLSEVKELTHEVEYLVQNLIKINQNTPKSELLVVRVEKANAQMQHTVEFGIKGLEAALNAIDYDKVEDRIIDAVNRHNSRLNNAIDRLKLQSRAMEETIARNENTISRTNLTLENAENKMKLLIHEVGSIPIFNQRLLVASSGIAFVAGVALMYLGSLVFWLPKPYYATPEQGALLQMVKDQTLHLESDALDSFKVVIKYQNINTTQSNTNTGDQQ